MKALSRVVAAFRAIQPDGWDVFAHLPVAVLIADREGRVARANVAAEELLGASESALTTRPLPPVLCALLGHPDGVRAHDLPLPTANGEVQADVAAAPIGERPGWMTLVITPHAATLAEGAPKAAATVAAMLAHEIKNPLAGIRGAAQLIGEGQDAETRELTTLICGEADRIRRLVERVEGLSEERGFRQGPVSLNETLRHVGTLMAGAAPGVVFREEFDPSLPDVEGDRDGLIQLFMNLVKNAVEATDGYGEIRLTTAFRYGARHKGRALPIEAQVIDNGPGVPSDLAPRLFEPFVSSKAAGRGLGLALVAKIADDHGATLDHSRQDGRTIFRLRFARGRDHE